MLALPDWACTYMGEVDDGRYTAWRLLAPTFPGEYTVRLSTSGRHVYDVLEHLPGSMEGASLRVLGTGLGSRHAVVKLLNEHQTDECEPTGSAG